jgi:hypothetical protein
MKELLPVARVARTLHRGQWSASTLPDLIGACLVVEPILGLNLLGISCKTKDALSIAINDRLVGSDRYLPVLGHEVAHLLLHDEGIHPCIVEAPSAPERFAWFGGALLTISEAMMQAFKQGAMLPEDIATECLVPLPFVELRYALSGAMRSPSPMARHAANLALDRWLEFLRH